MYDETSQTQVSSLNGKMNLRTKFRQREISSPQEKLKTFEFSGVGVADHKKVMGIAFFKNGLSNPDVYLVWQIPEQWSLESAATVPLTYLKVKTSADIFN